MTIIVCTFLQKLRSLMQKILAFEAFYTATLQNILTVGISGQGWNNLSMDELYSVIFFNVIKKSRKILKDQPRPLNKEYKRLRRSQHLLFKQSRTERYKYSFIVSVSIKKNKILMNLLSLLNCIAALSISFKCLPTCFTEMIPIYQL